MTLSNVAEQLDQLDDSHMIFAKRNPDWSATSEAVVCVIPDDDSDPPEAEGFDYFLEVDLAKETVQVWSEWHDGKQPTTAEKLDAMIYYAEYDAWRHQTERNRPILIPRLPGSSSLPNMAA